MKQQITKIENLEYKIKELEDSREKNGNLHQFNYQIFSSTNQRKPNKKSYIRNRYIALALGVCLLDSAGVILI